MGESLVLQLTGKDGGSGGELEAIPVQCEDYATTQSECNDLNDACVWNTGSAGDHTRSVVCKDSAGTIVTESLCPSPKPAITESCAAGTKS